MTYFWNEGYEKDLHANIEDDYEDILLFEGKNDELCFLVNRLLKSD